MSRYTKVLLAITLQVVFFACAGATYKYYFLDLPDGCYRSGMLLGHTPKDDLPLTECQPEEGNKAKCYVYKATDRERLMSDLTTCQVDLKACQGQ